MSLKTLLAISLISLISFSLWAGNSDISKLKLEVLRLRKENAILKASWQGCLEEYEKAMSGV